MAKQIINVGTNPNDSTGESLRAAMQKVNDNFTEVYDAVGNSIKGSFSTAYPASPTTGLYAFTGTDGTVVGGLAYYVGDYALYSSSTWTRIAGKQGTCTADGWNPEYSGIVCDGVDDYISIADNGNLNFPATPFMQEFFIKVLSDVTTSQYISFKGTSSFSVLISSGNLTIQKTGAGAWGSVSISGYAGKLLHAIAGWDGTNRFMYLNGQLVQSAAQSTNLIETNTTAQSIGSSAGVNFFKGSIYLVRFWNLALTASEILQLYNNGQPQNSVILSKYRGASQVNKITGDSSTFTGGVGGWVSYLGGTITALGGKGIFTLASSGESGIRLSGFYSNRNTQYLYRIKVRRVSGNLAVLRFGTAFAQVNITGITNTEQQYTFNVQTLAGIDLYLFSSSSDGSVFEIDDVENYQLGTVLELKGENMGHVSAIDTSGNRLHGAMNGTPALTVNPLQQKATTGVFTTNIADGVANKDVLIPAGYYITTITVANTLSSGNITNFKAVLDPASDNITLLSGKQINNAKVMTYTALADQSQSTSSRTLRFNATGNGAGGIEIMIILARRD